MHQDTNDCKVPFQDFIHTILQEISNGAKLDVCQITEMKSEVHHVGNTCRRTRNLRPQFVKMSARRCARRPRFA